MKIIAALAALTLLTSATAFAQTGTAATPRVQGEAQPIRGAVAPAPYIEELPGTRGSYHMALIRFPSAVNSTADAACTVLNYDGGPKFFATDGNGRLVWVICAWRQ